MNHPALSLSFRSPPWIASLLCLVTLATAASAQLNPGVDKIFEWHGTAQSLPSYPEELGHGFAALGDVNGDGFCDFVGGMPYSDRDFWTDDSGAAQVYSGFDGAILFERYGSVDDADLGYACSDIGDLNNDGFPDVLISAPGDGTAHEGIVWVYSGKTGAVIHMVQGGSAGRNIGASLANAGDINKDGVNDFIVGATAGLGEVIVYSGMDYSVLFNWNGTINDGYYGYSVDSAGDVNNDGWLDVIVGERPSTFGADPPGSAYVYSGFDGSQLHHFTTGQASDWFGYSVAGVGDLDNDGFDDVMIGSPFYDAGGIQDSGLAVIYSGQTGAVLYQFSGVTTGTRYGFGVSGLEDRDADGRPDFSLGYYQGTPIIEIRSGADGSWIESYTNVGFHVKDAGDINGDGSKELLFGSPGQNFSNGAVFVMGTHGHLVRDVDQVSIGSGGTVHFHLNFRTAEAGAFYAVLASLSGTGPVKVAGLPVPLTRDKLLKKIIQDGWKVPGFARQYGVLDGLGNASPTLNLPAGAASKLIGQTLYLAALAYDPGPNGREYSAPVTIDILP